MTAEDPMLGARRHIRRALDGSSTPRLTEGLRRWAAGRTAEELLRDLTAAALDPDSPLSRLNPEPPVTDTAPEVVAVHREWGTDTIDALVADGGRTYAVHLGTVPRTNQRGLTCECGVRVTLPCDWAALCPHMTAFGTTTDPTPAPQPDDDDEPGDDTDDDGSRPGHGSGPGGSGS